MRLSAWSNRWSGLKIVTFVQLVLSSVFDDREALLAGPLQLSPDFVESSEDAIARYRIRRPGLEDDCNLQGVVTSGVGYGRVGNVDEALLTQSRGRCRFRDCCNRVFVQRHIELHLLRGVSDWVIARIELARDRAANFA